MIVLDVRPMGTDRFAAYVDGELIVRSSRTPFLDGARALIARGKRPDETLVMRHPGGALSLKAALGYAARLAVREGDARPRFVKWDSYGGPD